MLYRGFLFSFVVETQDYATMKEPLKSKLKRAAIYMLGFSATPLFTACYGVPTADYEIDPSPFDDISGVVYGSDTNAPIPGIKVSVPALEISTTTNSEGRYHISHHFEASTRVRFEDIDGKENGEYFNNADIATSANHLYTNITLRKK